MVQRVRQLDVARKSGVSVSTVSRVFSGAPGISREVRDHVVSIAAALGYRAGHETACAAEPAPSLAVVSSLANLSAQAGQFHTDILQGVDEACRAHQAELIGLPLGFDEDLRTALKGRDGVLFLSIDDTEIVETARELGVPFGMINAEDGGLRGDVTLPDNEHGGWLAARHLLERGHGRIVFLQHSGRATIDRRRQGWRAAMVAHHGPDWPEHARRLDYPTTVEGVAAALASLRREVDFTAVCCSNDVTALAAIQALARVAYRVPDDVAVVGFDDLPVAALAQPPLTTIAIDRQRLGRLAVDRLLKRIGESEKAPVRTIVGTELIIRRSSGSFLDRAG